mmetsp:Transcript_11153/g.13502  ORF Transcript_11153/g.13502 Transcript_11153/m.13502 type:complete len:357 (+) Transcript_11153:145-1215(+)
MNATIDEKRNRWNTMLTSVSLGTTMETSHWEPMSSGSFGIDPLLIGDDLTSEIFRDDSPLGPALVWQDIVSEEKMMRESDSVNEFQTDGLFPSLNISEDMPDTSFDFSSIIQDDSNILDGVLGTPTASKTQSRKRVRTVSPPKAKKKQRVKRKQPIKKAIKNKKPTVKRPKPAGRATAKVTKRSNEWTPESMKVLLFLAKHLVEFELKLISEAAFIVIDRKPKTAGEYRAAEKKLKRMKVFKNWKTKNIDEVIRNIDNLIAKDYQNVEINVLKCHEVVKMMKERMLAKAPFKNKKSMKVEKPKQEETKIEQPQLPLEKKDICTAEGPAPEIKQAPALPVTNPVSVASTSTLPLASN